MFKKGNIYLLVFLCLLILIPLALYFFVTTVHSYCDYRTITEIASPDKSERLVIYKESCSLFNSVTIKGSILSLDEILEFHYDYIFKIHPKSLKFDVGGRQNSIDAVWKSPTNLSIYFDKDAEVEDKEISYNNINIEYLDK